MSFRAQNPGSTQRPVNNTQAYLNEDPLLIDRYRFYDETTRKWNTVKLFRKTEEGSKEKIRMSQEQWAQIVPRVKGVWQSNIEQITAATNQENADAALGQIKKVKFKTPKEKINIKFKNETPKVALETPESKALWLEQMRELSETINEFNRLQYVPRNLLSSSSEEISESEETSSEEMSESEEIWVNPLDTAIDEVCNSERTCMSSETMNLGMQWLEENRQNVSVHHVPAQESFQPNMLLTHDRISRAMADAQGDGSMAATLLGFQRNNQLQGQLLVPIFLPGHWVLAIIDYDNDKVFYYDPTGYGMDNPNHWTANRDGIDPINLRDFIEGIGQAVFEIPPENIIEYHSGTHTDGEEQVPNQPGVGTHQLLGTFTGAENSSCGLLCFNAAEQAISAFREEENNTEQVFDQHFGYGTRINLDETKILWIDRLSDGSVRQDVDPFMQAQYQSIQESSMWDQMQSLSSDSDSDSDSDSSSDTSGPGTPSNEHPIFHPELRFGQHSSESSSSEDEEERIYFTEDQAAPYLPQHQPLSPASSDDEELPARFEVTSQNLPAVTIQPETTEPRNDLDNTTHSLFGSHFPSDVSFVVIPDNETSLPPIQNSTSLQLNTLSQMQEELSSELVPQASLSMQERRDAFLGRMEQIQQSIDSGADFGNFEIYPEVLNLSIETILDPYDNTIPVTETGTREQPLYLMEMCKYATPQQDELSELNSAVANRLLHKWDRKVHSLNLKLATRYRNPNPNEQIAIQTMSQIYDWLQRKRESVLSAGPEEQRAVREEIREVLREISDAHEHCVDQVNSVLERLVVEHIGNSDLFTAELPPREKALLDARLALYQYRSGVVTLACNYVCNKLREGINPQNGARITRWDEEEEVALQREVKKFIAQELGETSEITRAGAYFAIFGNRDIRGHAQMMIDAAKTKFYNDYDPQAYLKSLANGMARDEFKQDLQAFLSNHFIGEEDSDSANAFERAMSAPDQDFTMGGDMKDAALFALLEYIGIISQNDTPEEYLENRNRVLPPSIQQQRNSLSTLARRQRVRERIRNNNAVAQQQRNSLSISERRQRVRQRIRNNRSTRSQGQGESNFHPQRRQRQATTNSRVGQRNSAGNIPQENRDRSRELQDLRSRLARLRENNEGVEEPHREPLHESSLPSAIGSAFLETNSSSDISRPELMQNGGTGEVFSSAD